MRCATYATIRALFALPLFITFYRLLAVYVCVCVRTNNEHKFKANINKIVNILCAVPRPQQAAAAASRLLVYTPQQLNLRGRRTSNKTMNERVVTVTVRYPRNG